MHLTLNYTSHVSNVMSYMTSNAGKYDMTKMVVGSTSAFSTIKPLFIIDRELLLTKTLLKQQCIVIRLCHHLQNVAAAIMTWL